MQPHKRPLDQDGAADSSKRRCADADSSGPQLVPTFRLGDLAEFIATLSPDDSAGIQPHFVALLDGLRALRLKREALAKLMELARVPSEGFLGLLPDELLAQIFSYLCAKDKAACTAVSRRIRRVVLDERAWAPKLAAHPGLKPLPGLLRVPEGPHCRLGMLRRLDRSYRWARPAMQVRLGAGHRAPVTCATYITRTTDRRYSIVATGAADATICTWRLGWGADGDTAARASKMGTSSINSVSIGALDWANEKLIGVDTNEAVRVWDVEAERQILHIQCPPGEAKMCVNGGTDPYVLFPSGALRGYDVRSTRPTLSFRPHREGRGICSIGNTVHTFCTGGERDVKLWDARNLSVPICAIQQPTDVLSLSSDSPFLHVAISTRIQLWKFRAGGTLVDPHDINFYGGGPMATVKNRLYVTGSGQKGVMHFPRVNSSSSWLLGSYSGTGRVGWKPCRVSPKVAKPFITVHRPGSLVYPNMRITELKARASYLLTTSNDRSTLLTIMGKDGS